MCLTKKLYSLHFNNKTSNDAFLSMSDYITCIKILKKQIDATKIEIIKNKCTLLVLMMRLSAYY